ncbi:hypothetical protein [Arthrobacter sp. AL12]|uniref:hypothetical protein n=1 Tax=Arthrobacter sp. AL12 TaxID=3042241 RepID=UPI00249CE8CB|nr:hypothetical protein [Arthrobacter sp. AL12]MDI3213273.1 hypothetical protein [Arthrobacter sp. AL12]
MDTHGELQQRPSRRMRVIAISLAAVLLIALGAWFAGSRMAGTERSDLVHLNNQRAIVANSMNLYEPLVNKFTTRYTTAFSDEISDEGKQRAFDEETGRLKNESRINLDRLQRMDSSPALHKQEVADAFNEFKRAYSAVIAYNDQLVINSTGITRSVGGACSSIHSKLNVSGEKYAEEYVKAADGCLAALSSAKEGSGQETTKLLSAVEGIIQKQRDSAQKVVGSTGEFERSAASIESALALLEINKPLNDAQRTYEADVLMKQTEVVEKANKSNTEFERILKDSLESAGQELKSEG